MSTTVPPGNLLTIEETAARLRLSEKTVRRLVDAGLLPAYRVARRAVRVDENQLEDWIYGPDDPGARSGPPSARPVPASTADDPSAGQSNAGRLHAGQEETR